MPEHKVLLVEPIDRRAVDLLAGLAEVTVAPATDATTLAGRGVPASRIHVTLERHMECGIGLCGHCQMGKYFVCRDGPVFSIGQLGDIFGREGI